jgi:hypothetical protein
VSSDRSAQALVQIMDEEDAALSAFDKACDKTRAILDTMAYTP